MSKKLRNVGILVLSLLMVFNLAACSGGDDTATNGEKSGEPIVLRLAENQPDSNPVTVAMNKFAELVEEKTNGEVKVEVYANAQLGQETENIDQVQAGVLDIARVNSVTLAQTVEDLRVFTLPYIFSGQEHKYKVLDGEIGQEVLKKLEDYNMVGFGYLEAGTRNFYTTEKPIKSLADLKGQKVRVQKSDVAIEMVKLLGGVPTPMNYGEVFTSLQTGVIDGAENDFVSYYTSGHYEVAKHYTLDGHLSPPALIVMSKEVWDGLSADHQEAIKAAAEEATKFERKAMNEKQEEFRKEVEAAGTTVYEVDVKEFQDAVAPLYDNYPQFADIIEKIRAVK
ncbi:TRAP transporter substrate-binding protein [Clostridiisalibacter paucivorans]|uniref:TRAP transporter substrate-binding protein n=1 Tax=Clostridiisalibacter paucivorans TaxID=408753 RepID=UPI0004787378|nr:TRAP transporter substrate-binding protein [Clostridiisalibacter paucivorans]